MTSPYNPYDEWGADRLMEYVELYGWPEAVKEVTRRLTKKALAEKRADGVTLGRPRSVGEDVRERAIKLRDRGWPLQGIADAFNDEGVPTGQGGRKWYPSTVRGLLNRPSP